MAVVARTYARALFEAAKDAGRVAEVRDELAMFVEAVDEVPELRALIRNPELDPPTKAAALDAVLEGADELLRNFVRVVAEKGRAGQLDEILREYEALVAAEEHILNVELTTAYELSDDEAAAIVKRSRSLGPRVEAARTSTRPDRRPRPQSRLARGRLERPRPPRPTSQRPRARVYLVEGARLE
jgi:F-type H+-transporting ATPase subunit delta